MKLLTPILAAIALGGPASAGPFDLLSSWLVEGQSRGLYYSAPPGIRDPRTNPQDAFGQNAPDTARWINSNDALSWSARPAALAPRGGIGTLTVKTRDALDQGPLTVIAKWVNEQGEMQRVRKSYAQIGPKANGARLDVHFGRIDVDRLEVLRMTTTRRNGITFRVEATANCAPNVQGIRSAMSSGRMDARSERREQRSESRGGGKGGKGGKRK